MELLLRPAIERKDDKIHIVFLPLKPPFPKKVLKVDSGTFGKLTGFQFCAPQRLDAPYPIVIIHL